MGWSSNRRVGAVLAAGGLTGALALWSPPPALAAADTVDEIHYSFGNDPGSVVFDWRGSETSIFYGPDTTYGSQATASPSAITPVDIAGPFEEVALSGLTPGSTYHYRIGADGLDHTFQTTPSGSFSWVDIGDSMSSSCGSWMPAEQALIAAQAPNFVTHGGDIAVPNQCGNSSLHQYYLDQQVWSTGAAFQPVWGDHEYGAPDAGAPPGTVKDSLANYKGRSFVTNGETVPIDTAQKTSAPGCPATAGGTGNSCLGEDWGWFQAGHVLFISYPEPWSGALADWQAKAAALMAGAQADPDIDFIVTYGHRPAYSSAPVGPNLDVQAATQALAKTYSPTATNPNGKYVLNVQHHNHGMEAFRPINGLTYITDAAGGQGLANFSATPDPNSVFRLLHFGVLAGHYDASAHSLTVSLVCGPPFNANKGVCTYGTTLFTDTFTRPSVTPPVAQLSVRHDDGAATVLPGGQLTYTTTVSDPVAGTTATGVQLAVGVPSGASFVAADAGGSYDPTSGTVTWALGDVPASAAVTEHVTVTVSGAAVVGSRVTSSAQVTATDTSCTQPASHCTATDDDVVASSGHSYIGNPGVETDLTGWAGRYGPSPLITVTRDTADGAHSGVAAIQVAALNGASGLNSGFSDKPYWVPSTVAGTTYTAAVWVKPAAVGQKISLRLRDWQGAALVGDKVVTLTAGTTAWQQLSTPLTAAHKGDHLTFIVYGNQMKAGQSFLADDMSLTSP